MEEQEEIEKMTRAYFDLIVYSNRGSYTFVH